MSSDILSREIDFNQFDMIWAGIQKNLGAAGAAFAVIRKGLLEKARTDIPEYLQYQTFVRMIPHTTRRLSSAFTR